MPQFMGIHKLTEDMDDTGVKDSFESYKKTAVENGLSPQHVHYSLEKGFAYCLTEASSEEEVRKAHEGAAPLEDVIEVKTID